MKKYLLFIISMLLIVPNVNGLSYQTKNRGFFGTNEYTCSNVDGEEVFYNFDSTGDALLFAEDSNVYLWNTNNTCRVYGDQDKLNAYAAKEKDFRTEYDDDGNLIVRLGYEISGARSGYIVNTKAYDSEKTYYTIHDPGTIFSLMTAETNVNEDTPVTNGNYYTDHLFVHVPSTELDPDMTYYKFHYVNYDKIFEVVTDPSDESVINLYIIDDDFEGDIIHYDEYIVSKSVIESMSNEDFGYDILNGQLILDDINSDGHVKHYDINGNQILTDYNDYTISSWNSKFIMMYNALESILKLYDIDFNLITSFEDVLGVDFMFTDYLSLSIETSEDFYMYFFKEYDVLDGADQTYTSGNLTVKFSGELSAFTKLLIDGTEVSETNYSKTAGSTVIEVNQSFISTLTSGEHTITAVYDDGTNVGTTFTISSNPNTIDNISLCILLGCISLLSISGIKFYLNKKRFN